jgi:hypothetical protein
MSQFFENIQYQLKTTSSSLALILFRLFIGGVLGLTFALIGQEIAGYGHLIFFFVIVLTMAVFNKLTQGWRFGGLFVFTLFCILLGALVQMYIQLAPGA